MTHRTRLFMLVSGGVLVTGLATGLLASYMGMQILPSATSGMPDELAYLPADSRLVAFANVRDVMDSELRQRLLQVRPSQDGTPNDFETRTGISIERDVDSVVASFAGGPGDQRPLLVVRGRFDDGRIEALLRERGATIEQYSNYNLFTIPEGDEPFTIAFTEPGVVTVGTIAAVRRAIDTRQSGVDSIVNNDAVMALVRDMNQGDAWAVGRFDIVSQGPVPQELVDQLPPIEWFAATGRINGGVEGLVRAEANTEQAAQDLRQVIQGFMALARLQSGRNAELAAMLDSLQLAGEGRTVSLSFAVPADVIGAFAARQGDLSAPDAPLAPAPPAPPAPAF